MTSSWLIVGVFQEKDEEAAVAVSHWLKMNCVNWIRSAESLDTALGIQSGVPSRSAGFPNFFYLGKKFSFLSIVVIRYDCSWRNECLVFQSALELRERKVFWGRGRERERGRRRGRGKKRILTTKKKSPQSFRSGEKGESKIIMKKKSVSFCLWSKLMIFLLLMLSLLLIFAFLHLSLYSLPTATCGSSRWSQAGGVSILHSSFFIWATEPGFLLPFYSL